jgi:hypothetical protein
MTHPFLDFTLDPLSEGSSRDHNQTTSPVRNTRTGKTYLAVAMDQSAHHVWHSAAITPAIRVALSDDHLSETMVVKVTDAIAAEWSSAPSLRNVQCPRDLLEGVVRNSFLPILTGHSAALHLGGHFSEAENLSVRHFLESLIRVSKHVDEKRQEDAIEKLANVLIPDPIEELRGVLAKDNLELRVRFFAEIPCLTSTEVAQSAGHSTKNASATASRWKAKGEIFSVAFKGEEFYPAFQFQDGQPRPVIKEVLVVLSDLTSWQKAFWFVSTNGWLNGAAPHDVLDDPEAVLNAAKRETEEVVG